MTRVGRQIRLRSPHPPKTYILSYVTHSHTGAFLQMTEQAPDMDEESDDRYATLEIAEGDVVIYDREEPNAWLQSDTPVEPKV